MGKQLDVFRAVVVLVCGIIVAACSQAPPEPAPVFTLPLSKVVGAPPVEGQPPAALDAPAARQLRYVAVPPGQKVAGMAHARIVLKKTKGTPPHSRHAHKKTVVQAVKKPTDTTEPVAKP